MVSVAWDAQAATLRLRRQTLAVLAAAGGAAPAPLLNREDAQPHLAALRAAGVVDGTAVTEALQPLAQAVADPRLRLRLERRDARRARAADGWVAPDLGVLLVDRGTDDDLDEVVALPPDQLPVTLADLVGLGPRPRSDVDAIALAAGHVDRLVDAGATLDAEVLAGWLGCQPDDGRVAALRAAAASLRCRWRLAVVWADDTPGTRLDVLDTDAGLWWLQPDERGVRLEPTRASAIWRELTGVLLEPAPSPANGHRPEARR